MSTQRPCVIYFACEFDKDMQTELCDKAQIFSALLTIQPAFVLWFWQIPHSGKSITFTPIWIRDHWLSAFSFWKRWLLLCKSLLGALAQSETLHTTGDVLQGRKSGDTDGICMVKGVVIRKVGHSITGPFWHHHFHLSYLQNKHLLWVIAQHKINTLLKSLERLTSIIFNSLSLPQTSCPNRGVCTKKSHALLQVWGATKLKRMCQIFWKPVCLFQEMLRHSSQSSGLLLFSHVCTKHRWRSVCSLWITKGQTLK